MPVLDPAQLVEDTPVEVRHRAQVELQVEGVAAAGEVLVELPAHPVDRLRGAEHARAEFAGEALELHLRLRVEADAAEAELAHAHDQRPDRRVVEQVVGHVEVPGHGRGRAEALVENGRDLSRRWGHRCSFSFRSRRTPAEAACRAACSFEPRAAPIAL